MSRQMKNRGASLLFIMLFLLSMIGCESHSSSPKQPKIGETIEGDVSLGDTIKEEIDDLKAIDDSVVVVLQRDVSIGLKVTGFSRLRLKTIREEVHDLVKGLLAEDYVVHVTTDKRLFSDLQKMEKELREADGDASIEMQEQLKKIQEDMQG